MESNYPTLPPNVNALAEVIGIDAALQLVERFGGSHLVIPRGLFDTHPIVECIGFDQALKLCRHFERETLIIPRCSAFLVALRNDEIQQCRRGGMTNKAIARQFKISERQVISICAPLRIAA